MRPGAKVEIGCWAVFWIAPILTIIASESLKKLNGGDALCSGIYRGTCSPLESAVHLSNFLVGGFAFFWIFFGWLYFVLLFGRIGYLLVKRLRKG
jgi:hypothetical protein